MKMPEQDRAPVRTSCLLNERLIRVVMLIYAMNVFGSAVKPLDLV